MADNNAKSVELSLFLTFGDCGIIFYKAKLYADMGLQGIFAGALLYGLWQWTHGRSATGDVLITRIRTYEVLTCLVAGVVVTGTLGFLLAAHTDASLLWVDSSLFSASLIAIALAARRNIASWLMWIIVDIFYAGLYGFKHLYLLAVLYAFFVALAVFGLRRWQLALGRQGDHGDRDTQADEFTVGAEGSQTIHAYDGIEKVIR